MRNGACLVPHQVEEHRLSLQHNKIGFAYALYALVIPVCPCAPFAEVDEMSQTDYAYTSRILRLVVE